MAAKPLQKSDKSSSSPAKESHFEWCLSWDTLHPFLCKSELPLPTESLIGDVVLVPGSGTSTLSIDLCNHGGFPNVLSIDKDDACIEHMKGLYPELSWLTADLIVENSASDAVAKANFGRCVLVVDKSTLDCILADGPQGTRGAASYLLNLCEVLAPRGLLVFISFKPLIFLKKLFGFLDAEVQVLDELCRNILVETQSHMPTISVLVARKRECNGSVPDRKETQITPRVSQPQSDIKVPLHSSDNTSSSTSIARKSGFSRTDAFAEYLSRVVDTWLTETEPLLCPRERERILCEWQSAMVQCTSDAAGATNIDVFNASLSTDVAYKILFSRELRQEMDYDMVSILLIVYIV